MNSSLASFRALHEGARRGQLNADERATYDEACEELARVLGQAERRVLRPGQSWKGILTVPRALRAELELPGGGLASTTTELSIEGFSAFVGELVPVGTKVATRLLVTPKDWVTVRARVTSSRPGRLCLAFEELPNSTREILGLIVFDEILSKLPK